MLILLSDESGGDGAARLHPNASAVFDTSACVDPHAGSGRSGAWIECPAAWELRIVRIYSPDRGTLSVLVNGTDTYQVPWRTLEKSDNIAAKYVYTPYCAGGGDCVNYGWPSGYTFVVRGNSTLEISLPIALSTADAKYDLFTLEYSEPQLSATQITLSISGDPLLAGGPCTVSSTHDRRFITPYGPLVPTTGAWWDCVQWAVRSGVSEFVAAFESEWPISLGTASAGAVCAQMSLTYCFASSVFDEACVNNPAIGCNFAGAIHARTLASCTRARPAGRLTSRARAAVRRVAVLPLVRRVGVQHVPGS